MQSRGARGPPCSVGCEAWADSPAIEWAQSAYCRAPLRIGIARPRPHAHGPEAERRKKAFYTCDRKLRGGAERELVTGCRRADHRPTSAAGTRLPRRLGPRRCFLSESRHTTQDLLPHSARIGRRAGSSASREALQHGPHAPTTRRPSPSHGRICALPTCHPLAAYDMRALSSRLHATHCPASASPPPKACEPHIIPQRSARRVARSRHTPSHPRAVGNAWILRQPVAQACTRGSTRGSAHMGSSLCGLHMGSSQVATSSSAAE